MKRGIVGEILSSNSIPFSDTLNFIISTIFPANSIISTFSGLSSNLPASIFEKSKISFTKSSSEFAETCTFFMYSNCFSDNFVFIKISENPITPLSGVLIS